MQDRFRRHFTLVRHFWLGMCCDTDFVRIFLGALLSYSWVVLVLSCNALYGGLLSWRIPGFLLSLIEMVTFVVTYKVCALLGYS